MSRNKGNSFLSYPEGLAKARRVCLISSAHWYNTSNGFSPSCTPILTLMTYALVKCFGARHRAWKSGPQSQAGLSNYFFNAREVRWPQSFKERRCQKTCPTDPTGVNRRTEGLLH